MGLRINQNIAAQNAYRNLSVTDSQMSKSLEKLSSGFRINRAADDAAGLSISEGLRSQIGGLKVAVRNTQDGVSVAQTAEGSLNEVTSILQRMRDLAVQASNSGATDSDAAAAANKEMTQLNAELDRIGSTTAFGKSKLLDGSFGTTVTSKVDPTTNVIAATAGAVTPLDTAVTSSATPPTGTFTFRSPFRAPLAPGRYHLFWQALERDGHAVMISATPMIWTDIVVAPARGLNR